MSDSSADRYVVEVLAEEFVERYRTGERPPLREYTQRYPEHAEEIEDLFPALLMMENLKPAEEDEQEAAAAEPELDQIGDYRILREAGRGGMGVVYEAEQLSLGRRVAVKVLPQQALLDPKHKRRFEREAKAAARLHHTNIVPVFGVGEQDGMHYYVMQFIQGLGLDEVLEELRRMKTNSQAGNTASQRELLVGRRSDQFSAAIVARSLMAGQFEQTVVSNVDDVEGEPPHVGSTVGFDPNGADARLDVRQSGPGVLEKTMESAGLGDTSSGRMADSLSGPLPLSGSLPLSSQSDSSICTSSARARRKQTFFTSVAHIGRQVASALQYAHEQGITHRDIKPGNLLLDMQGTVWVTDFGLAKANDQQDITHTGDILGTLRYMPPEAFEGVSDARGDQYSLGLTLYELLARRPAFEERDRNKLIKLVTTTEPTRIEKVNPDVPRDLATIIHKAIDRDPGHRYALAGELAADLERFLEDEPIQARRPSVAERLSRWSRRNRGLAASLAVISGLLLFIAIGSTFAAGHFRTVAREKEEQRRSAEAARTDAETAKTRIEQQAAELARERDRAEGSLYAARITLAENHLNSADGVNAQRSLDAVIPERDEADRRGWEWHYLNRWNNSAERTLYGHSVAHVYAVAFSPDGRLLASAGGGNPFYATQREEEIRPGEVLVREFATGRVRHTLRGHQNIVKKIAFSPDGRLLATAGDDHQIIFWDVGTGKEVSRMGIVEHTAGATVRELRFSPDGNYLLTTSKRWDLTDAAVGSGVVYGVPDGRALHQLLVTSADFSHDGTALYFVDAAPERETRMLRSLNVESGEVTDFLPSAVSTSHLWGVACSPQGSYVAAVNGGQVLVWDVTTQQTIRSLPAGQKTYKVTFSADDRLLCTYGESGVAQIWESASGRLISKLPGTTAQVTGAAFSPDGRWLATSDYGGAVRIFPAERDPRGTFLDFRLGQACAMSFNSDGTRFTAAQWNFGLATIDVTTGKHEFTHELDVTNARQWPRGDFALSPDSTRLAAPRKDDWNTVTIWDALTGEELISLAEHPEPVTAVAFSHDGRLVATAAIPALQIWDSTTGELLRTWNVGRIAVYAIAFSPDGKSIATGGRPIGSAPGVSIWDLQTGQARCHFNRPAQVYGLSFSPDGSRLAVADYGGYEVTVWDTVQGELIRAIPEIAAASDVAWSPDGTRLAAIGYSANVHLFEGETLEELIVLRTLGPPTGTLGFTPRVVFSPDGSKIAGNSPHGMVTVWDAGDGHVTEWQ